MGSPTLTRPQKVGNVRTYVDEVNYLAPADAPILAPEVDADLDTLYSAWNDPTSAFPPTGAAGGDLAGSTFPNCVVAAGKITRAKIATDAWLSPVPGAGDVGKVLAVASGPALAYVPPPGGPPTGAAGGDLGAPGSTYPNPTLTAAAKSKWTDTGTVLTPTPAAYANKLTLDNAGKLTVPGGLLNLGGSGGALISYISADAANGNLELGPNPRWSPADPNKPSWQLYMSVQFDVVQFIRRAATTGTVANLLTLDSAGNLLGGPIIQAQNYGGASANFRGTCGRGTASAPTPVLQYDSLVHVEGWGCYQAGANYSNQGQVLFYAEENWTATARGTAFSIYLTPVGTTNLTGSNLNLNNGGNLSISGAVGQKSTGTTWSNPSDIRIKKNIAPYTQGLNAILALQPKTFEFNGLGGSHNGLRGIGLIANDVLAVMPEMVSYTPTKLAPDDVSPVDLLTLDTTALQLALVNAVQELTARVAVLEGR